MHPELHLFRISRQSLTAVTLRLKLKVHLVEQHADVNERTKPCYVSHLLVIHDKCRDDTIDLDILDERVRAAELPL